MKSRSMILTLTTAAWARGHHNVIPWSAPAHATLAQPAAGADPLKDLRAQRAQESAENPVRFPEDLGLNFRA